MCVYLEVCAAESQPSGWSQHAVFSFTLVSQMDEKKWNHKWGPSSHTFEASAPNRGSQFIALTTLNDTSRGYILNDTVIIKC